MGFFSDLVEDVLDAGEKIVRAPVRVACAAVDHEWEEQPDGTLKCTWCASTSKPGNK